MENERKKAILQQLQIDNDNQKKIESKNEGQQASRFEEDSAEQEYQNLSI